jgi:hypothetical protein
MDLVMEIENFMDTETCKKIIQKHDLDSRYSSESALNISELNEWSDINREISEFIKTGYGKYVEWLQAKIPVANKFFSAEITEFRIEKHDFAYEIIPFPQNNDNSPLCTFFIHLNEPVENAETDFLYKKVRATTGKLVIFPATWTSIHRAKESKNKYVLMGTFYSK